MLRKERNDLLTQTGPGTPMGRMFRLNWVPALLADELPENVCPPVLQPPPPAWEFVNVPREQTITTKRSQECNWLQALEGGIDSSHVSFLHRGDLNTDPMFKGANGNQYNLSDSRPFFEVVESPGGLFIGARRNAENGHYYWRITQWVMPAFTMIPPRGDHCVHGHFWIPMDDENCWTWSYDYHPTRSLKESEVNAVR